MSGNVGITTTVPIEVIYAAGLTPVDLNNRFITSDDPRVYLERAETDGLPRNVCGWIRGLYGVVVAADDIDTVVGVTQGDCSNTHALMELFERAGRRVIPFAYPYDANRELLKLQIEEFMSAFDVTSDAVVETKRRLDDIRVALRRLDALTWKEHRLTGAENHRWLVSASDMNGDPGRFASELDGFLAEASARPPRTGETLLGCIGVPTIFSDLYGFLESIGARVVFNEMQRQFAMLAEERESPDTTRGPGPLDDLVEQYRRYTYPYRVWGRIDDIRRAIAERKLSGIIHTVQSFCYRQMEDVILRESLGVPVLTLEGDAPGPLDARSHVRLESFVEMLR